MMRVLHEANPEMLRNHPIAFILCIILIPFTLGISLVILLGMWLTAKSEKITIDEEKTIIRKGLFAKHTSEIHHTDVRSIDVSQGIINRLLGVGALRIGSASEAICIKGIRNPQQVKEICTSLKKSAVVNVRHINEG